MDYYWGGYNKLNTGKTMKKGAKKKIKKKIIEGIVILIGVTGFIAALLTISGIDVNDWRPPEPPKFDFQYEGLLEPNAAIYEVTEQLAWTNKSLLGEF